MSSKFTKDLHCNDVSKPIKKVMVTGANGFIGYELCNKLLSDKFKVKGIVRSKNYNDRFLTGIDISQLESVGPKTDWSEALIGIECVVHLAARAHIVNNDTHDPIKAFREINVAGTECLAREAASANVRRFIFISSVKVNGEGTETGSRKSPRLNTLEGNPVQRGRDVRDQEGELKGAFSEKDIPEPRDPYGISKWEAEKVLNKISEETGMEIVILRSPLVYGPEVKANFLRLLKVIEHGIPLPLASVNNRRSFIYLGNLVDAIITCMKHPKAAGQTYFVSDGEDVSTPEMIQRISSALGRPSRLFQCPINVLKGAGKLLGKMTEMERLTGFLTVDISKIMNELGWAPPFSMEQGLKETATWYLKRKKYLTQRR